MADLIIDRWRLAVLRVRLDLGQRVPSVLVTMVGYPDGSPTTMWSQSYALEDFGIPDYGPPSQLTVPDDLVQRVGRTLFEELSNETALWLRLEPPYGYLGAVPWEDVLVSQIYRPMLRVPDRLPVAADFGEVWTAAVVVQARPGSTWVAQYLNYLFENLRQEVLGPLEIHLFADAETTALINAVSPRNGDANWLRVHDPASADEALNSRSAGRAASSRMTRERPDGPPIRAGQIWADWISVGLAGRALRSLHVVIDTAFDGDRPMMVLSPDPKSRADHETCTFVPIERLLQLADAVGAATLSLGSPPDNESDVAMRILVDQIGQQRAGPTIYSSIHGDPAGGAIAAMHAYLADRSGQRVLPWDHSLFAYVQPEHVKASLVESWPEPADLPTSPGDAATSAVEDLTSYSSAEVEGLYAGAAEVPAWVASSHRYLGNEWANLARAADPQLKVVTRKSYDKGAAEALDEIRDIVERHSRS